MADYETLLTLTSRRGLKGNLKLTERETLSHPFLSPRLALGVAPLLLARQPRSRRGVAHLASIHCTRNRICPTTPTPPHHRRGNKVSNEQSRRTQPLCANLIQIGMYQTIRWFQSYKNSRKIHGGNKQICYYSYCRERPYNPTHS